VHDHGSVGISIGPTALRVLLLAAVMVVAAFTMLRGFTGPPAHRTAVWVWSAASAVVVAELLLSGGLDLPQRVIPLVLAATGAPAYVIFNRDPRFAWIRGALRTFAPWLCAAAATLAATEFARAWLSAPGDTRITLLHTGVHLAGMAVSWLVISRPRTRRAAVGLYTTTAVLAILVLAGAAYSTGLRPARETTAAPVSDLANTVVCAERSARFRVPPPIGGEVVSFAGTGMPVG
jgi:hypothetical protein